MIYPLLQVFFSGLVPPAAVAVYITMLFASHFGTVCALLFSYGVYYGMTEGAERARVADFVAAKDPRKGLRMVPWHSRFRRLTGEPDV